MEYLPDVARFVEFDYDAVKLHEITALVYDYFQVTEAWLVKYWPSEMDSDVIHWNYHKVTSYNIFVTIVQQFQAVLSVDSLAGNEQQINHMMS